VIAGAVFVENDFRIAGIMTQRIHIRYDAVDSDLTKSHEPLPDLDCALIHIREAGRLRVGTRPSPTTER